jgi:hypothetical protein
MGPHFIFALLLQLLLKCKRDVFLSLIKIEYYIFVVVYAGLQIKI